MPQARRRHYHRLGLFGLVGFCGCIAHQPWGDLSLSDTRPLEAKSSPQAVPLELKVSHSDMETKQTSPSKQPLPPIASAAPAMTLNKAAHESPSQEDRSAIGSPVRMVGNGQATQANTAVQDILQPAQVDAMPSNAVQLNLPSTLAIIDGQHPIVGLAQWRVQQAYAELAEANVLWLPSIQSGFSFHRHDGNYQASDGAIVDVNRNSFQYGLGAGANGAGTTFARPGVVAQFHFADAIFQPKVAETTAWARGHAARTSLNDQLLEAGSAYVDLLSAHQDLRILQESQRRVAGLDRITADFAEAGQGLQADADRMRTELSLIDNRLLAAQERTLMASARLAQALSIEAAEEIVPMDVNAVPLDLTDEQHDKGSLIRTGLANRPELKESQALVAAAYEAYRRERFAPFVPSVLLGFSTGGFGGGLGNELDNMGGRYDLDALMTWEVRNLGLGERAARRRSSAQMQQARFEKLRLMDQVARDISEAHAQVNVRRQQVERMQQAIGAAENSYRRNLERIQNGQGLPLEVLQSAQAFEDAQRTYLQAVIDYNQAQLRLQWALGWPVSESHQGVAGQ